MNATASAPSRLLFDGFELRLDSGELLRDGSVIKLQPQPTRVLELLASRAGEVVSREEIRQAVWGDSFVDFDASLNFCIKQIRRALDDSATEPRYLETVPKRGYRFLRPVRTDQPSPVPEAPPVLEPEPVSALPPAPAPEPSPSRVLWPRVAGLAGVALAALVLVFLIASRRLQPTLSSPRLAVLPLECQSQAAPDRQVCGGVTEVLTAELTRQFPRDLEVIAPPSVLAYEKAGKEDREIGRELGATHLMTGEVDASGRKLRMTARLLRTSGGGPLWEETLETDLGDAPLLYEQVVRQVARALRLPPPPEPKRVAPPSAAGYEAYLRGMYLLRQQRLPEAAASLQESVLLAPDFAPGYAALAEARMGSMGRSAEALQATEAAARKALALDPRNSDAHLVQGALLFTRHYDWARAGQEFRRALALDPGNAEAHYQYGLYLTGLGRHKEAVASVLRARELDPASMYVNVDVAWFQYQARQYADAVVQSRKTLDLLEVVEDSLPEDPIRYARFWANWVLLRSAWKTGDEATAVEAGRELIEQYGEPEKAAKIQSLQDFLAWQDHWAQPGTVRKRAASPFLRAVAVLEAGRPEQAIAMLEESCRTREDLLLFAGAEPAFDPLRKDPRFARFLDCAHLPADAPARRPAL